MKLKVLTYNIRHCLGIDGSVSLKAVASTIAATGAQIAGLQEVDCCNPRSLFFNQAHKLGRLLGMYAFFGPNVRWGCLARFGNAVVSSYPIVSCRNYPLPSVGEKRGLLRAEIVVHNRPVAFYTTHLGLNQEERLRQVDTITDIIADDEAPLVLTGDFNARPDAAEIQIMQVLLTPVDPAGAGLTFPADFPKYKIDYIFVSKHWEVRDTGVHDSRASDHLPLAADLKLRSTNHNQTIISDFPLCFPVRRAVALPTPP
ncbi:endonuclease/exonuclease/phosphatase family protein [Desulfoscipio geothermicus]|uniref:Metal-dependent hydrolase, endonuclease/exonuclease/phosphatase family n=1 Tax=Desulfoscipio geothermicus DSM 3669 TaxID=1121426 RepID=A0A1I6E5H6_9FIRM|nr:endonuclease/exonuclease/phosphatase family protein [Desulfoscipio geothermicus]SFR12956.1 Metal-dependent hydrolase, endonuclease/exonuclease/phosphatase family [Desulfoscipio geothermicus DSM 3669]